MGDQEKATKMRNNNHKSPKTMKRWPVIVKPQPTHWVDLDYHQGVLTTRWWLPQNNPERSSIGKFERYKKRCNRNFYTRKRFFLCIEQEARLWNMGKTTQSRDRYGLPARTLKEGIQTNKVLLLFLFLGLIGAEYTVHSISTHRHKYQSSVVYYTCFINRAT